MNIVIYHGAVIIMIATVLNVKDNFEHHFVFNIEGWPKNELSSRALDCIFVYKPIFRVALWGIPRTFEEPMLRS